MLLVYNCSVKGSRWYIFLQGMLGFYFSTHPSVCSYVRVNGGEWLIWAETFWHTALMRSDTSQGEEEAHERLERQGERWHLNPGKISWGGKKWREGGRGREGAAWYQERESTWWRDSNHVKGKIVNSQVDFFHSRREASFSRTPRGKAIKTATFASPVSALQLISSSSPPLCHAAAIITYQCSVFTGLELRHQVCFGLFPRMPGTLRGRVK